MSRWLFLPDTVQKDLEILSRSSEASLGRLRSLLDSDEGLRPFAVYLRVGEILGISDQEAAGIYLFWEYVQRERTESDKTGEDALEEFLAFLSASTRSGKHSKNKEVVAQVIDGISQKRSSLERLFGECPKRDFARKTSLLESGPLPHLANIKTFCDVRPIYNNERSAIVDHVALITLRLGLHSAHLDEMTEVLVNLREIDLDRIETELKRLRQKLAVLKMKREFKATKARKTPGA